MRLAQAALALTVAAMTQAQAEPTAHRAAFSDFPGWAGDDHAAALMVFRTTCDLIRAPGWAATCRHAETATNARAFFEDHFAPVLFDDGKAPLFTGYYEPELMGSRNRTDTFRYPLYKRPPDMPRGEPWLTRGEIDRGALDGRGLELAWLSDPVEAFFLHVQGSGRLRLPDGATMRVGFAAKNGHRYRSVGREMVRRGHLPEGRVSAAAIKKWVRAHPVRGREVLWHNPSFVFFRELTDLAHDAGPIGAMGRPVAAMRSIAIDPDFAPLGAPVWVDKRGRAPITRLMVAQDTGSAIRGAQRADIFFGSGAEAGKRAGVVRDKGRMWVLLPRKVAEAVTGGG